MMNKKEINEIKKQMTAANCNISRLCGCYVNGEKEKVSVWKSNFLSLPEEEMFKYLDIFKKTLSGTVGKNLLNMEYETAEDLPLQKQLLDIRNTKLNDDDLLNEFFDDVIGSYQDAGNYYIILANGIYDIPSKAKDGEILDSVDVFDYLLCAICPVELAKPGLSYHAENGKFEDRNRDWVAGMPLHGFLWPAFTDRQTNIHEVLYYTKKSADIQETFIQNVIGTKIPNSCEEEKESFHSLFDKGITFEKVQEIHQEIAALQEMEDEPLKLDEKMLGNVFEKTDTPMPETFKGSILATNVLSGMNKVKVADTTITTNEPLELKVIDGKKYILVPADAEINFNDIRVNYKEA